jgi:hypothetical protein
MKVKVFLVVLFIGMAWLWAKLPPRMGPQQHRAAGPHPELSLTRMQNDYAVYNSEWFNGKLPKDTVMALEKDPVSQANSVFENGHWTIRFNPRYNMAPSTADFNLFHEMCHMATPKDRDHGPVWEACMEELALNGAFHNVW